tara:strand:+ start:158 stop:352 length:195 start_codon:yes stop_codon:yes gene_type:complete
MLNILKYMAITAAGMAVIEAHGIETHFMPSKDYVNFNISITKTVFHRPECACASLNARRATTTE